MKNWRVICELLCDDGTIISRISRLAYVRETVRVDFAYVRKTVGVCTRNGSRKISRKFRVTCDTRNEFRVTSGTRNEFRVTSRTRNEFRVNFAYIKISFAIREIIFA